MAVFSHILNDILLKQKLIQHNARTNHRLGIIQANFEVPKHFK